MQGSLGLQSSSGYYNSATPSVSTLAPNRFSFRPRAGRINWRFLHGMEATEIVKTGDTGNLEAVMENLMYSKFSENDLAVSNDTELSKLVHLMQLGLELTYSRHMQSKDDLESVNRTLAQALQAQKVTEEKYQRTKRELQDKRRQCTMYENLLHGLNSGVLPLASRGTVTDPSPLTGPGAGTGAGPTQSTGSKAYMKSTPAPISKDTIVEEVDAGAFTKFYACPGCHKKFESYEYLERHVNRRHPNDGLDLSGCEVTAGANTDVISSQTARNLKKQTAGGSSASGGVASQDLVSQGLVDQGLVSQGQVNGSKQPAPSRPLSQASTLSAATQKITTTPGPAQAGLTQEQLEKWKQGVMEEAHTAMSQKFIKLMSMVLDEQTTPPGEYQHALAALGNSEDASSQIAKDLLQIIRKKQATADSRSLGGSSEGLKREDVQAMLIEERERTRNELLREVASSVGAKKENEALKERITSLNILIDSARNDNLSLRKNVNLLEARNKCQEDRLDELSMNIAMVSPPKEFTHMMPTVSAQCLELPKTGATPLKPQQLYQSPDDKPSSSLNETLHAPVNASMGLPRYGDSGSPLRSPDPVPDQSGLVDKNKRPPSVIMGNNESVRTDLNVTEFVDKSVAMTTRQRLDSDGSLGQVGKNQTDLMHQSIPVGNSKDTKLGGRQPGSPLTQPALSNTLLTSLPSASMGTYTIEKTETQLYQDRVLGESSQYIQAQPRVSAYSSMDMDSPSKKQFMRAGPDPLFGDKKKAFKSPKHHVYALPKGQQDAAYFIDANFNSSQIIDRDSPQKDSTFRVDIDQFQEEFLSPVSNRDTSTRNAAPSVGQQAGGQSIDNTILQTNAIDNTILTGQNQYQPIGFQPPPTANRLSGPLHPALDDVLRAGMDNSTIQPPLSGADPNISVHNLMTTQLTDIPMADRTQLDLSTQTLIPFLGQSLQSLDGANTSVMTAIPSMRAGPASMSGTPANASSLHSGVVGSKERSQKTVIKATRKGSDSMINANESMDTWKPSDSNDRTRIVDGTSGTPRGAGDWNVSAITVQPEGNKQDTSLHSFDLDSLPSPSNVVNTAPPVRRSAAEDLPPVEDLPVVSSGEEEPTILETAPVDKSVAVFEPNLVQFMQAKPCDSGGESGPERAESTSLMTTFIFDPDKKQLFHSVLPSGKSSSASSDTAAAATGAVEKSRVEHLYVDDEENALLDQDGNMVRLPAQELTQIMDKILELAGKSEVHVVGSLFSADERKPEDIPKDERKEEMDDGAKKEEPKADDKSGINIDDIKNLDTYDSMKVKRVSSGDDLIAQWDLPDSKTAVFTVETRKMFYNGKRIESLLIFEGTDGEEWLQDQDKCNIALPPDEEERQGILDIILEMCEVCDIDIDRCEAPSGVRSANSKDDASGGGSAFASSGALGADGTTAAGAPTGDSNLSTVPVKVGVRTGSKKDMHVHGQDATGSKSPVGTRAGSKIQNVETVQVGVRAGSKIQHAETTQVSKERESAASEAVARDELSAKGSSKVELNVPSQRSGSSDAQSGFGIGRKVAAGDSDDLNQSSGSDGSFGIQRKLTMMSAGEKSDAYNQELKDVLKTMKKDDAAGAQSNLRDSAGVRRRDISSSGQKGAPGSASGSSSRGKDAAEGSAPVEDSPATSVNLYYNDGPSASNSHSNPYDNSNPYQTTSTDRPKSSNPYQSSLYESDRPKSSNPNQTNLYESNTARTKSGNPYHSGESTQYKSNPYADTSGASARTLPGKGTTTGGTPGASNDHSAAGGSSTDVSASQIIANLGKKTKDATLLGSSTDLGRKTNDNTVLGDTTAINQTVFADQTFIGDRTLIGDKTAMDGIDRDLLDGSTSLLHVTATKKETTTEVIQPFTIDSSPNASPTESPPPTKNFAKYDKKRNFHELAFSDDDDEELLI